MSRDTNFLESRRKSKTQTLNSGAAAPCQQLGLFIYQADTEHGDGKKD